MKTLLILLLGLLATDVNAGPIKAVAKRVSDTCVTVSLPSPPDGDEYHAVSLTWLTWEGIEEVDNDPIQVSPNSWKVFTPQSLGTISGIYCTDVSCTPFEADWRLDREIIEENRDNFKTAALITLVVVIIGLVAGGVLVEMRKE